MFERFSGRARQVIVLAQEEARGLKHHYIGTEHVLLGLLGEQEGLAVRVLEARDVTLEHVRGVVVEIVGVGAEAPSGQIPITPRAKKVLELAVREARSLDHDLVESEHILLALARENGGVAARILSDLDVNPGEIRRDVFRLLGHAPQLGASGLAHSHAEPVIAPVQDASPVPPRDLGWRGHPMALAALGAAVLARRAFHPSRTARVGPLEMQVLIRLALGPGDPAVHQSSELVDSLAIGLACERDELRTAVHNLTDHALVHRQDEQDDEDRVAITGAGVSAVQRWLTDTIPLFGDWPPDFPGADDAIG